MSLFKQSDDLRIIVGHDKPPPHPSIELGRLSHRLRCIEVIGVQEQQDDEGPVLLYVRDWESEVQQLRLRADQRAFVLEVGVHADWFCLQTALENASANWPDMLISHANATGFQIWEVLMTEAVAT